MSNENTKEFVPPSKVYTTEFIVGLFAIFGLFCLGYLAINIGGIKFSDSGIYKLKAEFSNVAGLKVGAPVEIAGVKVGEIAGINLLGTNALVTLEIENNIQVRDDDILAVRTKGIIGDRYLKIIPGASSNILKLDGKISDTESSVEFEEILGKLMHSMTSPKS